MPRSGFLLFILLFCASAPSTGADLTIGVAGDRGLGFDLHLARDEYALAADAGAAANADTRLSRAGVTISENFADGLDLALLLGYASASQRNQPLTAGMRFTGNYFGVAIHATVPAHARLRIGIAGHFLYHWLRDEDSGQKVALDWAEAGAALTLQADLGGGLVAWGGPLWSTIGIDREARGNVNETAGFADRNDSGAVYGLRLELDGRGAAVGVEVRRGPYDGVALSFQQRF